MYKPILVHVDHKKVFPALDSKTIFTYYRESSVCGATSVYVYSLRGRSIIVVTQV